MQRVEFANTLRGGAALAVLLSHYFCTFWASQPRVASIINTTPLVLTDPHNLFVVIRSFGEYLGAFGVALFFLISGFVIPFSLSKLDGSTFMYRRMWRLLPTYAAGFSISLIAICLSGYLDARSWHLELGDIFFHYLPGLHDLSGAPNIDGIIWTLDIEIKFYVVCAMAAALFRRQSRTIYAIPFALCALMLSLWLLAQQSPELLAGVTHRVFDAGVRIILTSQFICYMFIGTAFYGLYRGLLNQRQAIALFTALLGTYLCMVQFGPDVRGRFLLPSYLIALTIFTAAFFCRDHFRTNLVFGFFADISYPLYVVHAVSGYVSLYWLTRLGIPPYASLPITALGVIGVAYVLHRFVEVPTRDFRKSALPAPVRFM